MKFVTYFLGIHVLAHLVGSEWIEADPGVLRVVTETIPSRNPWFTVPVKIVRWTCLDNDSCTGVFGTVEQLTAP